MKKTKRRWWTIYKTSRQYRVRARASNGKITFASSEGYRNFADAVSNAIDHGAPHELWSQPYGVERRYLQ